MKYSRISSNFGAKNSNMFKSKVVAKCFFERNFFPSLHFTGVEISEFSLLPKRDIKKRGSSIIKVLKAERRVERREKLLLKSNLTCGEGGSGALLMS